MADKKMTNDEDFRSELLVNVHGARAMFGTLVMPERHDCRFPIGVSYMTPDGHVGWLTARCGDCISAIFAPLYPVEEFGVLLQDYDFHSPADKWCSTVLVLPSDVLTCMGNHRFSRTLHARIVRRDRVGAGGEEGRKARSRGGASGRPVKRREASRKGSPVRNAQVDETGQIVDVPAGNDVGELPRPASCEGDLEPSKHRGGKRPPKNRDPEGIAFASSGKMVNRLRKSNRLVSASLAGTMGAEIEALKIERQVLREERVDLGNAPPEPVGHPRPAGGLPPPPPPPREVDMGGFRYLHKAVDAYDCYFSLASAMVILFWVGVLLAAVFALFMCLSVVELYLVSFGDIVYYIASGQYEDGDYLIIFRWYEVDRFGAYYRLYGLLWDCYWVCLLSLSLVLIGMLERGLTFAEVRWRCVLFLLVRIQDLSRLSQRVMQYNLFYVWCQVEATFLSNWNLVDPRKCTYVYSYVREHNVVGNCWRSHEADRQEASRMVVVRLEKCIRFRCAWTGVEVDTPFHVDEIIVSMSFLCELLNPKTLVVGLSEEMLRQRVQSRATTCTSISSERENAVLGMNVVGHTSALAVAMALQNQRHLLSLHPDF